MAGLVREWAWPTPVLLCALGAVLVAGIISPQAGMAGLSNPAVLMFRVLYAVAAGIWQSGALAFFWEDHSLPVTLAWLMGPTVFFSRLLDNKPTVAVIIPRVQVGRTPSQLLLSPSHGPTVGGMTTLIGIFTDLVVVSGLLVEEGYPALGFFECTSVGLPVAGDVLVYFILLRHRLFPNRIGKAFAFETN